MFSSLSSQPALLLNPPPPQKKVLIIILQNTEPFHTANPAAQIYTAHLPEFLRSVEQSLEKRFCRTLYPHRMVGLDPHYLVRQLVI